MPPEPPATERRVVSGAGPFDVAVVGAGFGGAILARGLAATGRRVLLVDRQRHPRFALGESATPLAAISLERLAGRPGLADLAALAAAGRWRRELPAVGHGVKRGFTFYGHRPGRPFRPGNDNRYRLLVAASPGAEVADSHWLRADLDQHLAAAAAGAGVELREGVEIQQVEFSGEGVRLTGRVADEAFTATAGFLVDASGPGGLARHLGVGARADVPPDTALLFGHFTGVGRFEDALRRAGVALEPGPYPDDAAAVHHVLAEGWMYVLRFAPEDSPAGALASAGFVLRRDAADRLAAEHAEPAAAFAALLGRYPSLAAQLADRRPTRPVAWRPRLSHRSTAATGERWLALPHAHAFYDPLYSTGIAWTLVAVERALDLLAAGAPTAAVLARYAALLEREADHVERLVTGAWAVLDDFPAFTAWSHLYFAAASYAEASQRLLAGDHAWQGFLGADDPVTVGFVAATHRLVTGAAPPAAEELAAVVGRAIAGRNVAGLADPARRNLYPVDTAPLLAGADLLGIDRRTLRSRLSRLRRV